MITYRGLLDVPRELVASLAGLLAGERPARGTRTGSRALTCWYQAVLVLVWYRKGEDIALLGAGFGVSRATPYRYRDEAVQVLAAAAPDLHDALRQVAEQGWSHVILNGTLVTTDRCAQTTTSVQGTTIERGTPDSAAPSAATFKRSCDLTGCRSRPPTRYRGTCTT